MCPDASTALLIDMDGVLYQGEQAIAGAAETLDWLRANAVAHRFVTNASSRPRAQLVARLAGHGITVAEGDILTPLVAAADWLREHADGPVAAFVPEPTLADLGGLALAHDPGHDRAGAVVVGDLGAAWDFTTLNRAFRFLMQPDAPPLLALGMTRYWRAEDGLRLDTAPFVMALAHASGREPQVFGKPAAAFFERALAALGTGPATTWMIGDDLRGDVGGAQAAGLRGLLVRTGKFRADELAASDIRPEAVLDSIADLPRWWSGGD
ncbi:TIGR01458 family HAD-type hydrolase [Marichromatium gracile]|uniref:Haloacid dehalogenase-like hydrolase domain-containing protein 2 n=1 Tax=Marichromatium gracile TaxID=1048 RepID=A0ABR5VHV7_MARGR|nr:TIGR01458 family HAD-type hydrolase [Marichromatium gracile]KXX65164.1 haloacid dehalogenase [Marichromatium gracile]